MILAIDFDGTITEKSAYPTTGKIRPEAITFLKSLREYGAKLILWTCRTGADLDEAVRLCYDHGLVFDAVNDNIRLNNHGKNSRRRFMMKWLLLIAAGLLEVFWSTCLKFSEGFTVMKYSVLTVVGMILSFVLLSQAMKSLPLGTAYGIWTGIGALGAIVAGIILFKESVSPVRLFFAALLLIGIIGLKATSAH